MRFRPARTRSRHALVRRVGFAVPMLLVATLPFGILSHVAFEVVGLADRGSLAAAILSSRHLYLAGLVLAAIAAVALGLRHRSPERVRATVARAIDALPFRGHGPGFVAVSFAAQFGFAAFTLALEGSPALCAGDLTAGTFAAIVAAVFGAVAVALGQRGAIEFGIAIVYGRTPAARVQDVAVRSREARVPRGLAQRRTPFAFRYRPPPSSRIRATAPR